MTQKRVYISAPYTALSKDLEVANITKAVAWGYKVKALGATALVPHKAVLQPTATDPEAIWGEAMQDCLSMLDGCHAILMVENWEDSRGCRVERDMAMEWEIPVFHSITSLDAWLRRAE